MIINAVGLFNESVNNESKPANAIKDEILITTARENGLWISFFNRKEV